MGNLIRLIMSDTGLAVLNVLMLILTVAASALSVWAFANNNVVSVLKRALKRMEESGHERMEHEELLRKTEGNQEKDSIFYKTDLMLNQSGIKRKLPFFSTEYLMLFSTVLGMLGLIIAGAAAGLIKGIIAAAVVCALPYLIIKIAADINYKKTEGQILHFLNMVENYTRTYDNIITIFGKIYPFLEEPLSTAVKECYIEATNTGDVSMAFRRLETKVVHEKFSEILRNLELCSRYEANYHAVVSTSRDIISNYIKSRKKIKGIVDNAKIDFVLIMVCTVVMLGMIDSFIENGSIISILLSGPGLLISAYMTFIIIYAVFSLITLKRK